MTQAELTQMCEDMTSIVEAKPKRITFERIERYMKISVLIIQAFVNRFLVGGRIKLNHWVNFIPYLLFAREVYKILKASDHELQNMFKPEL